MVQQATSRTARTNRERLQRTLYAVVGLAISIVSVLLVLRAVDLLAALAVLASASPVLLLAALAVSLVGLALRIAIWWVLLPPRPDGSRVPIERVAPVVLVGLLGNTVLPARLGEIVRAYLIQRRERVGMVGALASILLERIIDVAVLAVLGFAAATATGVEQWIRQGMAILAAIGGLVVLLLAGPGLGPIVRLLPAIGRIARLRPAVTAIQARLEAFAHWSGGRHRRPAIAVAALLAAAAWGTVAASFLLLAAAVGATLSPWEALLVMAVTVLATAIPSAPAYVGTFELAAVSIATALGVPAETALAFAILAHLLSLLPTLVGGPIALAYIGVGLRPLAEQAAIEQATGQDVPTSG